MDLAVLATRLAGNPGALGWIQAYEHIPQDENLLMTKGKLFVLIYLDFETEEISSFSEGREILAKIQNEYYEKEGVGAFESLKYVLNKILSEYQLEGKKINIATSVYINRILYVAVTGSVQAGVIRDGANVKILIGRPGEVVAASGYPKENDVFILATNKLFEAFSDNDIKNTFLESPTEQVAEKFESKTLSPNGILGVGVIALKFGGAEKESLPFLVSDYQHTNEARKFSNNSKFSGLFNRIQKSINNALPGRKITIRQETQVYEDVKDRKKLTSLGILLLFLLVVSIIFGVRQNNIKVAKSKYEDELSRASHSFEQSLQIASIDKERSIELFLEAKTITNGLRERGIKSQDLEKLFLAINESEGSLLGEYKESSQLYINLALVIDGFSSMDAVGSGGEVVFLGKDGKNAILLNIETKRAEAVANMDKVSDAKRIAVYAGRVYVLNNDGIVLVGKNAEKVIEKEWGEDVFIRAYGGNIYLLDRGNSTVYRYPGLTSGFASKQLWLAPGIKPDFSEMTSWTIDGSIWVGYGGGDVEKYSQGSPKIVEIKGLGSPMSDVSAIYSDGDIQNMYLLESGKKRIVVTDKEGNYICQYKADDLGNATELFVSEARKIVLFLTEGNKLFSIELKHLN